MRLLFSCALLGFALAKRREIPVSKVDSHRLGEKLFSLFDVDYSGHVTENEYANMVGLMLGENVPPFSAISQGFSLLDKDGDGSLRSEELVDRMSLRGGESEKTPVEIHLALTGDDTQMRVIWITMGSTPLPQSMAQYGPAGGSLSSSVAATNRTYNVGIGGFHGVINDAVMTGLVPGASYNYKVGSPQGEWSRVLSFRANSRDSSRIWKFAVFGDMGTAIPIGFENAADIARDVEKNNLDAVVHVGDLCYAGTGGTIEVEFIWDVFGDQTEKFSSVVPYMTGVGNHEHYYNYTSFLTRYSMPAPFGEPSDQSLHKFWFSFRTGSVHWCMMSTEHSYEQGSEQYEWLVRDLAAARNSSQVSWIFLTGHRPMYSSDIDELSSHIPGAHFQSIIEPLMIEYNVDLYLSGHQHAYERIHPVIDGNVKNIPTRSNEAWIYRNPGAPMHFMQGTGGTFTDHQWEDPQPVWSGNRQSHIGYGRITILNTTALHYEYVSGNTVNDDVYLYK